MAASNGTTKFFITYEDGTEVTYKVKPRHLVAFEDEVGDLGEVKTIKDGYKLAWLAAGTSMPYLEWLEGVDSIDSDSPDLPPTAVESTDEQGDTETVPTESPSHD